MVTTMHEGFLKDDLDQEDFCDNGGGIQSIHREDIDESDDFLDESLDGDDRNKDSISVLQESNFDMVILFHNAFGQELEENYSLGLIYKENEGTNGIEGGATYYGLRPVVEFMTFNFSMQALDHIINSAAKSNYMSAGQINVPIVFRRPNGTVAGCFAAWYGACLSLKVLAPYPSEDARGLLKAAIRDSDPIVFLENELLYGESFLISAEVLDSSFCLPIGKAKVERERKDVTITTFSRMVGHVIKAAEILAKEGISAEVINLRSIRPLDRATINASVWKTSTLVVTVEEGFPQHVIEESFMYLDAPSGKVFIAKGMQVHELVGKETMDLLSTDTGIEVDKKKLKHKMMRMNCLKK
ncbi:hypothetical protein LOK49_LG01G00133 [Camellia lanceoleosa]|uniref:Uncharacterized protein n=1 Tax=Camellia lanceoleosa TaxID=1840588 RepID=A0ACC0J2U5_9ERIC|nr:hypothetical protein LOK49_LG01G00133 [Camellia lanceoleosa]